MIELTYDEIHKCLKHLHRTLTGAREISISLQHQFTLKLVHKNATYAQFENIGNNFAIVREHLVAEGGNLDDNELHFLHKMVEAETSLNEARYLFENCVEKWACDRVKGIIGLSYERVWGIHCALGEMFEPLNELIGVLNDMLDMKRIDEEVQSAEMAYEFAMA